MNPRSRPTARAPRVFQNGASAFQGDPVSKPKDPQDKQTSHTGKVMNDINRQGGQKPTQKN